MTVNDLVSRLQEEGDQDSLAYIRDLAAQGHSAEEIEQNPVVRGMLDLDTVSAPDESPAAQAEQAQGFVEGTARGLGRFAKEQGPEIVGGMLGGRLADLAAVHPAGRIARPVTGPLLSGAGTAAGYTVGRLARGEGMPSLGEVGTSFGTGAASDAAGRALIKGVRWLFGFPDEAARAAAVARRGAAKQLGIQALPGDVNPGAAAVADDFGRTMTGGPPVANAKLVRAQQTGRAAHKALTDWKGSRDLSSAGEAVADTVRPSLRRVKNVGRAKYTQATNMAEAMDLEIPPNLVQGMDDTVQSVLDDFAPGVEAAQSSKLNAILTELQEKITGGEPLRFADAVRMRRDLIDALPRFEQRGVATRYSVGALEHLERQLDDAITSAAKGTPVESVLGDARAFWRDEVVPLRKVVGKVQRAEFDDQVVDILVRAKRPDRLRALFRHIDPEEANALRAGWFTQAFEESMDPSTGAFNPEKFLTRWDRMGSGVQEQLTGQNAAVRRLVDVLRGQQEGMLANANRSQSGRAVGRLGQAVLLGKALKDALGAFGSGGGLDQATGAAAGELGLYFGLPYVGGKVMSSRMLTPAFAPTAFEEALMRGGVSGAAQTAGQMFGPEPQAPRPVRVQP